MTTPATNEAARIPVPVADRTVNLNSAASGGALGGATGGVRWTARWRAGIGHLGAASESNSLFTAGSPQTRTNAVRIAHGSHALNTRLGESWVSVTGAVSDIGDDCPVFF